MLDTTLIYDSINYGKFRVLNYINANTVVIEFIKTNYKTIATSKHIKSGAVKDLLYPIVRGVAFFGVGTHKCNDNGKRTEKYRAWNSMIDRCYSEKVQESNPAYKGCTVCDEWLNFQNFGAWFDKNYIEGYQLDKDIKIDGNRVYSPGACLFVSQKDNSTKAKAKEYLMIDPSGCEVKIYNMKSFCNDNGLCWKQMSAVFVGNHGEHKGWTAKQEFKV